jgi:hypothetical protein
MGKRKRMDEGREGGGNICNPIHIFFISFSPSFFFFSSLFFIIHHPFHFLFRPVSFFVMNTPVGILWPRNGGTVLLRSPAFTQGPSYPSTNNMIQVPTQMQTQMTCVKDKNGLVCTNPQRMPVSQPIFGNSFGDCYAVPPIAHVTEPPPTMSDTIRRTSTYIL